MKGFTVGFWLLLAALVGACLQTAVPARAQDAPAAVPAPRKEPARVPFTAFRVKPILEPKLKTETTGGSSSLVVQDIEQKKPEPRKAATKTEVIRAGDGNMPALTQVRPASKPATPDDIVFSPSLKSGQIPVPVSPDLKAEQEEESRAVPANTASYVPVPPRKPEAPDQMLVQDNAGGLATVIERIVAVPDENLAKEQEAKAPPSPDTIPVPPPPPAPDEVTLGPGDISESSVRIRSASRFGSQSRMAGGSEGFGRTGNLASIALPKDMQNLRLGSLGQGKGVSPVLMPGQKVTMAAPDAKRMDSRGLPSEVIVFFQESSAQMEVGQMDVLNNDVISVLRDRPDLEVEIVGYAEPQKGGKDETSKMALARALMVQQYLSRQRISGDRLTVKGKGDNTSIEPRDRVEMYFSR